MSDGGTRITLPAPLSFFEHRASFQQIHLPDSTRTDPFRSRRAATRPSRLQADRWRRQF